MTTDQKEQIRAMRLQGLSYGKISKALGISDKKVRSFCTKTQITELQRSGLGYRRIAAALDLPVNTVKSFCRRHPLQMDPVQEVPVQHARCRNCGEIVDLTKTKCKKLFCSDACRMAWWNTHRNLVQKKTMHTLVCESCGKSFEVYGKPGQRFCSRACYYDHRRKAEKR